MAFEFEGTYDFNLTEMIFGVFKIEGFEEGTEITVERDEDSFTDKTGVDGNVIRSRSNNNKGTVTFTLNQFSKSNKILTNIANVDERSGAGVFPFKLTDKSNPDSETTLGTEAWIVKPSSKSYGSESGPREWTLRLANMNFVQL